MGMSGTGQGQAEALPPKAANTLGHWVTQAATRDGLERALSFAARESGEVRISP